MSARSRCSRVFSACLGGLLTLGVCDSADDDAPARIDPDVDASRNDFLQDGLYSQLVSEVGFVKGAGFVPRTSPRATPGGSTYHTDGLRAVLFYVEKPLSLNEIEFIGWERLLDHLQP